MREIKFRMWDNVEKKMIFEFPSGGSFGDENLLEPFRETNSYRLTPQQFTGLKDKNGKDIYEGDICVAIRESDKKETKLTAGMAHAYVDWFQQPFEIIGNIYENPELLPSPYQP